MELQNWKKNHLNLQPIRHQLCYILPQSNHVAIGSDDGTIKVFDLEGKLLKTFKGHKGVISDIDVSQEKT